MAETEPSDLGLDRFARRLARFLTAIFWGVAALLLLERLGYTGLYRGTADPAQIALQLLLSLPAALNLASLWMLRRAVASMAGGDFFGPNAISALKAAGILLIAGSVAALLLPLLSRALGQADLRLINADVATLILAAIGVGQLFIGAVMERAAAAERELREFF
jgi:hypothetical protein